MAYTEKPEPEGKDLSRGEKRRWTVPPPYTWDANRIDGIRLLDATSSPGLRLTLFIACRAVQSWAFLRLPPHLLYREAEAGTSAPEWYAGDAPAELHEPLATIREVIEGTRQPQEGPIFGACTQIGKWAYTHGDAATETTFFTLAASILPEDAGAAFLVGRAARRDLRYNAAEEWFRRTIGLARRSDDDASYVAAYLGWGVLEDMRGRREHARRRFVAAWRKARAAGMKKMMAAARHYLVPLAVGRSFEEGYRHAVAAYKLYGPGEYRLALLAIDTGAFLIDNGFFSAAIPLLSAAVEFPLGTERKVGLCNLARAVAAVGDRKQFLSLWLTIYETPLDSSEALGAALTELACGALTLGQTRRAEQALQDALSVAADERSRERAAALIIQARSTTPPQDNDKPPPPEVSRFVERFTKRLRRMTAPG
jgi:tetratricopeptide (TPR) repeat protein